MKQSSVLLKLSQGKITTEQALAATRLSQVQLTERLQEAVKWTDKNYVYDVCLKHLEAIGRIDLVNDLGYALTGFSRVQLFRESFNGVQRIIEQAERLAQYTPPFRYI